jgi:molybdopterin-containing oxidoreductase family molybdopterin binding subunit
MPTTYISDTFSDTKWDAKWESLPHWDPPHEAWFENEKFSQYPIVMTSVRPKTRVHTIFGHVESLLEIKPEPYLRVSRADAKEREIKDGDLVKVYNDRGYVVVKAYINEGVRPGVAVIEKGWQSDQYIDGNYSDMTSIWSPAVILNTNFFDCLCQIEKI